MDLAQHHGGSSDEESEMEWEEVEATAEQQPQASTSKLISKDFEQAGNTAVGNDGQAAKGVDGVEVTLRPSVVSKGGKVKGKGKGRPAGFSVEAQIERANRQELHKVHTCCLLLSGHVRNGWLNDKALQARLLSKVPLDIQNPFHDFSKATHPRATDRSRLFENAMRHLTHWWYERFWFDDTHRGVSGGETDIFEMLAAPHSIETESHWEMLEMLNRMSEKDRVRLMMPFAEEEDLLKLHEKYMQPKSKSSAKKKQKLPKPLSAELGELIRNPQSLAKRAVQMVGTRDMSAQLFTALCRSLDIPARLVCALPSVDHRSANKQRADEKLADIRSAGSSAKKRKADYSHTEESDDDTTFEEVKIPSSVPKRALGQVNGNASDASSSSRKGAARARRTPGSPMFASRKGKAGTPAIDIDEVIPTVPTFWTEVYNRALQEWVTVDVIRDKFRPRKGEMDNGRMFYVVAYEVDQYIKDVTPRYAKSYSGRTLKMRVQNRRKEDPDWWEETLHPWTRPFALGRELKEDEDLMRHQESEPMPTVLEGFKNHPRFVLERHLKREEVLLPKTKQFGLFRGEPVYPRSAVVSVKSSENWMREGRQIKDGEQALKMVKQRAVTINRRRAQELAMQDGQEPLMQGLYSRRQTELVIPPPIVDGKVPKNSYGNLDLFAPHMLPKGAVHLPHRNIRKVARDLGIDHAEAITGFEFHKRRAVPTVTGIVVAAENKELILEAYYAQETVAVEKELEKKKIRALKKWKKLIVGLRVRSRIQGEYRSKQGQEMSGQDKGKGKSQDEGVSQLVHALPEEKPNESRASSGDASGSLPPAGGFLSSSLRPEIPGNAAFPGGQSRSVPNHTLDDTPQIDLTALNLPPMPIPEPAAGGLDLPAHDTMPHASTSASLNGFTYPPQSQLNETSYTGSDPEDYGEGGFIQDGDGDNDDSTSSSSRREEEKHDVEMDDFTLGDPESMANGAPEIAEADGEQALQGGFIRDEEEDVEKKVVGVADSARNSAKHVAPDIHQRLPTDVKDEEGVNLDRSDINGKTKQSTKADTRSRAIVKPEPDHSDNSGSEEIEDDVAKTDGENLPPPPAPSPTRPASSKRATRTSATQPVNGTSRTAATTTKATSAPASTGTRRSSRRTTTTTRSAVEPATSATKQQSARATRSSRAAAAVAASKIAKEDSDTEDDGGDGAQLDVDVDEDETEEETIEVSSKRSAPARKTRAAAASSTESNNKAKALPTRSTRSSRR